jgi:hypothetical protein
VIKNPFQLRNVRKRIAALREKLPVMMEKECPPDKEFIKINNLQAVITEIEELVKEIEDYERLDDGDLGDTPPLSTIREAGDNLTKWRIAKGMNMMTLATLAKKSAVDLERHELADWETADLGLLIHLAIVIEEYQPQPEDSEDSTES